MGGETEHRVRQAVVERQWATSTLTKRDATLAMSNHTLDGLSPESRSTVAVVLQLIQAGREGAALSNSAVAEAIARLPTAERFPLQRQPQRHDRTVAGQVGSSAPSAGVEARLGAKSPGTVIRGPLAPGEIRVEGQLVVQQIGPGETSICYGDQAVTIRSQPGGAYAFRIDPEVERAEDPEVGVWPLMVGESEEPKPRQRVIQVTGTSDVTVDRQVDPTLRVPPLVVHERTVSRREDVGLAHGPTLFPPGEPLEMAGFTFATLQLDDTAISIDASQRETWTPRQPTSRAPFAYWVDPEWTGPDGVERRVTVVAAPGVFVRSGEAALALLEGPTGHLRLVPEIVRVPHPDLVPAQGTRFKAEDFAGVESVMPGPQSPFSHLLGTSPEPGPDNLAVATGLAGVTVSHPWSGAQLSLRVTDRERGAAYAYQVLAPENGRPGEIRAVVGPGVEVEVLEPVPRQLRDPGGFTATPLPGAARPGEGLEDEGILLTLVEVDDASVVPPQGTPLNMNFFYQHGHDRRPDRHEWVDTSDLSTELGRAGADVLVGMIPVVGDLVDIGEFIIALHTDRDRWGREVTTSDKVLMGVGAVIGLIPLLGGVGTALRRVPSMALRLADVARAYRKTPEQLEVVLMRVDNVVQGEDATLVRRALASPAEELQPADIRRIEQLITQLGAQSDTLRIGRAVVGPMASNVELATESAGRGALRDPGYVATLVRAVKSTDSVPQQLARPLVRSGAFENGSEAAAAVEQAALDAARKGELDIDAAFAEYVGQMAGVKVDEMLEITTQTRRVAVSRPDLLDRYESLANQRMPQVVERVLDRQRATPTRRRLLELAEQFESFRNEVGNAAQLTADQQQRAMQILRQARPLARRDFGNVQKGIMRQLRRDPQLLMFERQLRAAGDIADNTGGGIRIRTQTDAGDVSYEPANVEHLARLSDDPWSYNRPDNLLLTDAAQNQQHLEALRQHGSIWPTGDVERFIVTHGLHDQDIDFAPGAR